MVPIDLTVLDIARAFVKSGVYDGEAARRILRRGNLAPHSEDMTMTDTIEINTVDTMIGFWLLTLDEDEIIDVGQICTTATPGGAPEWQLDRIIDGLGDHKSRMEALCLMFGTERLREVMATVANHPERLGLDRPDVVTNAIVPLLIADELPF